MWKYPISVGFCIFIWKIKTFLHLFKLPVWARQTYLRFSTGNKKESLSISLAAINIIKGKAEKFSALLAKARKNVLWLNGRVHSYEQAQGVFLPSVINTEKAFLVFHPRRRRTTRLPPLFKRKGNKRSRVKKEHKEKKLAPNRNKLPFEKRRLPILPAVNRKYFRRKRA